MVQRSVAFYHCPVTLNRFRARFRFSDSPLPPNNSEFAEIVPVEGVQVVRG